MSVFVPAAKLAYYPVPKVACTSLKMMFFEIANDFTFRGYKANWSHIHIHNVYPSRPFGHFDAARVATFHKIAVVRDPVARLLSCYGNRVTHWRELSAEHIPGEFQAKGATPDPDLATFIDRLEVYRQASKSIWHHTNSFCFYLGRDPSYFDRIYGMSELDRLRADLSARLNEPLELKKTQQGGRKFDPADLSKAQIRKIQSFYSEDYEIWGSHFLPAA